MATGSWGKAVGDKEGRYEIAWKDARCSPVDVDSRVVAGIWASVVIRRGGATRNTNWLIVSSRIHEKNMEIVHSDARVVAELREEKGCQGGVG